MRRLPILPTLLVVVAVATMIGLGVWQLHRAAWKDGLLARYQAAEGQPLLLGLPDEARRDPEAVAFRRTRLSCTPYDKLVQIGGRNRAGGMGYRTITGCRLPQGGALMVDIGWSPPSALSARPNLPREQTFVGRLIPDAVLAGRALGDEREAIPLLLVSDAPAAGLEPSVPPSIEDIPNNHRAYAVQWFLFAGVAFTVYVLALRRRRG